MTTFKPGQRVMVRAAAGGHTAKATLVRTYTAREQARSPSNLAGWWVVRFDHGGSLACHEESLQPVSREARRLWIAEEADRLCIPAFATPRWQRIHGRA